MLTQSIQDQSNVQSRTGWEAPTMSMLLVRMTAYNPGNSADAAQPVRPGFNITMAPGLLPEAVRPAPKGAVRAKQDGWEAPSLKQLPVNGL